jgi:hypothetical protein
MQTFMKLRQHGHASLGFTVPVKLARAWDLRIGDAVLWEAEGDLVTLKFFKLPRATASEPQGEGATVDAA